MAVSIDRVYQKVLAFANKEQRGYITPQEFNLFADQAQMEIFEQYFYDINQWTRQHGNNHPYSDMVTNLQEKIDIFQKYSPARVEVVNTSGWMNLYDHMVYSEPGVRGNDLYRIGSIRVRYGSKGLNTWNEAQFVTREELSLYDNSKLLKRNGDTARYGSPTYSRFFSGSDRIQIHPNPEKSYVDNNYTGTDFTYVGVNGDTRVYPDRIQIFYTRKPIPPIWGYVVVNDKALYNSTSSTDFELHASEESELVYRILAFAGVAIEKPQLTQIAAGLEQAKVQQEKQ